MSPAEMLMSRRLRTQLLVLPSALKPRGSHGASSASKECLRRPDQQRNFNLRHNANDLPTLQPDDPVWIRDQNRQVQVVSSGNCDRTYLVRTDLGTVSRNRRALVPTSRESDDNDRWTPPVRVSTTSDIATPTLLIAGRAASCALQCPTPPLLRYNYVADIHWECVVRCLFGSATLTRCRWRQFHLVIVRFIRFRRTGECRARSCRMGLCDGVWMNYLNRQRVMSHLVSQVPSTHAVLVFRRASFVRCLACSEKW